MMDGWMELDSVRLTHTTTTIVDCPPIIKSHSYPHQHISYCDNTIQHKDTPTYWLRLSFTVHTALHI